LILWFLCFGSCYLVLAICLLLLGSCYLLLFISSYSELIALTNLARPLQRREIPFVIYLEQPDLTFFNICRGDCKNDSIFFLSHPAASLQREIDFRHDEATYLQGMEVFLQVAAVLLQVVNRAISGVYPVWATRLDGLASVNGAN
jgi:hypothetical protein